MATSYVSHFSPKQTPQTQPIPGRPDMVPNSAGGYGFQVDEFTRLQRFLILGNEGGTYYATERKLTIENAECVQRCLAQNPVGTVFEIVHVSKSGRAPKNDPAIFALALATASKDEAARRHAYAAVPIVCRTGTHLFQFVNAVNALRGWGEGLRKAIANWYTGKPEDKLVYQLAKYQQRDGWSHKDVLRLCHPKGHNSAAIRWAIGAGTTEREIPANTKVKTTKDRHYPAPFTDLPPLLAAMNTVKGFSVTNKTEVRYVCDYIRDLQMPRECIPTEFLNLPEVWEALLEKMPMTAMVRNLATMTRVGIVAPMSQGTSKVLAELGNVERIHKSRLHPIAILAAMLTYASGRSVRGSNTWTPVSQIVDALDAAFYSAFKNVPPTGKRWMLALDISGSMGCGVIAGIPGLTPRNATAALALVTANVEPQHCFVGFSHQLIPLNISPRQRLDDVIKTIGGLPFGRTDASLAFEYAAKQKIPVDIFVTITDNESWSGSTHATQALTQYRQRMGIADAKSAAMAMTATAFTIADPTDPNQMDFVGCDTNTPVILSDFARGQVGGSAPVEEATVED